MFACDFCEDKVDKVIGFVCINARTQTQTADHTLKLCFSCFENNLGAEIEIDDAHKINSANSYQNVNCMFCKTVCWKSGNTKNCAIEVNHRWVQYRICNACWKRERDL